MNKYQVIYADPPWDYKKKVGRGATGKHYKTLSLEELKAMAPMVNEMSDVNCALFLWVTSPMILEGISLMSAWGFRYVTVGFNWVKTTQKGNKVRMGPGNYTRPGSELCLLGIRGKMKREGKGVHQVIHAVQRKHSQKPDEVYGRINKLYPDASKIELFARQEVKGWDCWGDEV